MYKKGIKILEVKIGILSNREDIIDFSQFFYLETNYNKVESIDFHTPMDTYLYLYDQKGIPVKFQLSDEQIVVTGDISQMIKEASDKRYGFFGNLGLITRVVLFLLEKNYGIFSFHAAGLYDEKEDDFYIILGSAGSGKSTFLLRAIQEELKIFGTELVHFKMEEKNGEKVPVFFRGALLDNIRIGNLKYDYPKASKMLNITIPEVHNEWISQVWEVDMNPFSPNCNTITDPKIVLLHPYVERKWEDLMVTEVKKEKVLRKILYDNVSEKVSGPFVLFDEVTLPDINNRESLERRMESIREFIAYAKIKKALQASVGTQHTILGICGS